MTSQNIGLGPEHFRIAIFIANRPPLECYQNLQCLQPLAAGELGFVVQHSSNHWRKLFSVYAKFLFSLGWGVINQYERWQEYRDEILLQERCIAALMFSPPRFDDPTKITIIAGKTHAASMDLPFTLTWQDEYFAVNIEHRCIVCPYLDYRQLTNERIERLVSLVKSLN